MGEIKKVRKKHALKDSWEARRNIENLHDARKAAMIFLMNML